MLPVAILCGGLGTRLLPKTETIPKALIPVNGTPFILLQLRSLRAHGIRQVVLLVSYLAEMIEAIVGDGEALDLQITYSYDGPTRIGTGGAVRKALPLLGDGFFVVYGDSFVVADYGAIEKALFASGKAGLMTVWRNRGRLARSNVEMRNGALVRYDKEAPSDAMEYIDWGLSAFRTKAFDPFLSVEAFDLGEVHGALLATGELVAYEVNNRFYEVGSHEGLAQIERYLAANPEETGFLS
jgi:N-acetyl-alpha-D-muramate 1-phosphate uridylyltransferase